MAGLLLACAGLVFAGLAGGSPAAGPERDRGGPWPAPRPAAGPAAYVPGELVVGFRAGVGAAAQARAVRARGGRVERSLRLPRTKLVGLPADVSVEAAARALARDPDVLFAEPNYLYRAAQVTPNDPQYAQLWALPKIRAPEAWALGTGDADVVVAVIDTGVASDHPDLAANMAAGYDFVQRDDDPLDFHGHGTHVAGTIGAVGNNARGVVGVNWTVSLMPLRAGDTYGSFPSSAIVDAFTYACTNGARVVNGSFGGPSFSSAQQNAIAQASCADTLFVFAAGNDGANNDSGSTPSYPCNYASARIVCVAATTSTDKLASYSNYGTTSVDLGAPGSGIRSTVVGWEEQTGFFPEGFEDAAAFATRWGGKTGAGTWNRTSARKWAGGHSLGDSPGVNYAANANESIRTLVPLDLTGKKGCQIDYRLWLQAQQGYDGLWVETSTSPSGPWTWTDVLSFTTSGWEPITSDLSTLDGSETGYLRFRFTSDATIQYEGAYVDAIDAWCLEAGAEKYASYSGTSMAAPHVAGVAALVLARNPTLTTAQLRAALLETVDAVPALAGKVATGGRLNAYAAVASVAEPGAPAPPELLSGPSGVVSQTAATFTLSAGPGATLECRLGGGAFEACSSPVTYAGLADGAHVFQARAVNAYGTSSAASRTWTVDTVPPAVPLPVQTGRTATSVAVGWPASADPSAPVSYDVFVNGVHAATKAQTTHTLTGLACGQKRTVGVEAVDAAGNRSARGAVVATTSACPPPRCRVPRLRGRTLKKAKAMLVARHCRLGHVTRRFNATVRKGRVVKQSRPAGARPANGAKVHVVVSRGRR